MKIDTNNSNTKYSHNRSRMEHLNNCFKITFILCLMYSFIVGETLAQSQDVFAEQSKVPYIVDIMEDYNIPVLQNGASVRFTARPPLYDIRKSGETHWYPCAAEVVESTAEHNNAESAPNSGSDHKDASEDLLSQSSSVTTQWLTPKAIPHYNYSAEGSEADWPTLPGHGYFVAKNSNHTLVLVHPDSADGGRYKCQVLIDSHPVAEVSMQLFITAPLVPLWMRTLWGLAGAILICVIVAVGYLVNSFLIKPYSERFRERLLSADVHRFPIQDVDELSPSLQDVA